MEVGVLCPAVLAGQVAVVTWECSAPPQSVPGNPAVPVQFESVPGTSVDTTV